MTPSAPGATATRGALTPGPSTARSAARGPVVLAFVLGLVVLAVLCLADLLQGTAELGVGDLLGALVGHGDTATAVLLDSRLPRLLAGLLVGAALGVSGLVLQAISRNPLASPDTLAVNAGAYTAVTTVAVVGLAVPFYLQGTIAFAGGLLAALLVLLLARGGADGPARLVLAGSAIALALNALTTTLLVLFQEETRGLFAWGNGTIVQSGTRGVTLALPVVVLGLLGALLLARRLDLLALGDDAARVLGVDVRSTRTLGVLTAVLLAAVAVTVAGPLGFVGLAAPVIARLVARRVRGLGRHALLVPFAALCGMLVVLAADVALRLVLPVKASITVPTGVVTTLVGAALMVWLALRLRDSGGAANGVRGRPRSRARAVVVLVVLSVLVVVALVAGLLLGDRLVLLGDVANWLAGTAGRQVGFVLDQRVPRVLVALLAGAALALAGAVVQGVCRNPLAEPGLLGVSAGAGLGAVAVVVLVPGAAAGPVALAAVVGALATFALVYGLAARGGLGTDRLVLVGVGVAAAAGAATSLLVLVVSPWDTNLALTWLSGSTYGRSMAQVVPVLVALVVLTPVAVHLRRDLDVLALDEDTPRVLGVAVGRSRLVLLTVSALLTAAAVSAVGVIGFVGLVAPHAARALVGARHVRVLPVAMLLGALLVSVADTIGRTAFAPVQLPAGLVTAVVGAPYFVWLLWRDRRA
ncbi:iron complex transport system permease protein [Sediminihabitans luteus]|uniref:Iron complex transport system permease protein n=1 Tax=Sediminihabitans luteus TaxID=1138585 RepID=A0A2M9CR63_9CELL|nr:iron ABC transporter permease [Sediminihabitans luteus]PJJ74394.1 iron complex transport system permease protein [Sediminihabitans luteus]GIJ00239.1 iron-hydroxamate transporter permease subunit [Sediminihabitans luteus]